LSKSDSLSNLAHYVKVKVDIVVGRQDGRGDFSGGKKMAQISARVSLAHRTNAFGIYGTLVCRVSGVLDQYPAFAGIQASVPRRPSGQDAIHHVDALRYVIRNLFRTSYAHQITGTILR
jgi:hypothetical protein